MVVFGNGHCRVSPPTPPHFNSGAILILTVSLFLLGWAWTLVLLPFNLAPAATGRWNNPSMIAMLAIGTALFPVFFYWEWKIAKSPMLTKALLRNRTFLLAVTIDFFYFAAGNMRSLYWGSYVYVVSGFTRASEY